MSDETQITDNTEATETGSVVDQVEANQEARFTQEDVDRIIRSRLAQVERKYEGIDVDEYQQMKSAQAEAEKAQMMKKEQFEELLKQQKTEADARINQLQGELQRVHVDGALKSAAVKHKVVNPDHVSNLLKSQIRLGDGGAAEVLDTDGNVRYNTDTAMPYTIDELVQEFVTEHSYMRSAAPAGTGSVGNAAHTTSREVELKDLDMSNPDHRRIYKEKYATGSKRSFTAK